MTAGRDLLEKVIEAHGGLARWQAVRIEVDSVIPH